MKINKVHCLFEQSGTFKNELKALGIDAEDYDIQNEFGQTDNVKDLFSEIDKAYDGEPSIFDNIGECDLVFAFFPCTRFEAVIPLAFRGEQRQQEGQTDLQKLEYSMKLHEELHGLYMRICKLFTICLRGGWRMIVENPATQPHYLTQFFPIKPKVIDKDRTSNGDYYRKPTQYWFVNCEPENNVVFEPIEYVETHTVMKARLMKDGTTTQTKRSMIHKQYARRFIKNYVLDAEGGVWTA
jgi:hypothetical protein